MILQVHCDRVPDQIAVAVHDQQLQTGDSARVVLVSAPDVTRHPHEGESVVLSMECRHG
jgi:hypothetical protein